MSARVLASLALALVLGACEARETERSVNLNRLTYQRDARTGECFAVIGYQSTGDMRQGGLTITWVPCSDGVLRAIKP